MKKLRDLFSPKRPQKHFDRKPDPGLLAVTCCGRLISKTPLITFTNFRVQEGFLPIAELGKYFPDLFQGTKGLHVIATNWFTSASSARKIKAQLKAAVRAYPGHEFIMLVANEVESYLSSKAGIPTIVANKSIFEDEALWQIRQEGEFQKEYDAVYLARLDKFKRHELASQIGSLSLVYSRTLNEAPEEAFKRYRAALPNAHFVNHHVGNGEYVLLKPEEVCDHLNRARVGLCLSPAEGVMRASIQYMLCGLPVVSTPSIGGRDRYYNSEYCKIVEPDPAAIGHAVQELISQDFDPKDVRASILEKLEFDRYNFLHSLKRIAASHFEIPEPGISFDVMKGAYLNWLPMRKIIKDWQNS